MEMEKPSNASLPSVSHLGALLQPLRQGVGSSRKGIGRGFHNRLGTVPAGYT